MDTTPLGYSGTTAKEVEAPEDDAEFLTLSYPTQGVTLQLTSDGAALNLEPSQGGNLFAISGKFGWAVSAGNDGFSLHSVASLRAAAASSPAHTTPTPPAHVHVPCPSSRVEVLRFAMSDKIVLAGFRDGTVGVWRLKSLVEGNTTPTYTLPAATANLPILDLLPCPAPLSPLVIHLTSTSLSILNLETQSPHYIFPSNLGAIVTSWSVKGKQLVIGTLSGEVLQFTPEGTQKGSIALPPSLVASGEAYSVRALEWLENTVFLVTYEKRRNEMGGGEPPHDDEVFVVTTKGAGQLPEYEKFMDPTPAFGMTAREGRRWTGRFKNWSPFKHLLFTCSSASTDIGVIGQLTSPTPHWATLALPDSCRPSLPLGPSAEDVCPLGLELDLSIDSTKPAVLVYTSQGVLVVWEIKNEFGGVDGGSAYEGMKKVKDVLTQGDDPDEEATPAAFPIAAPAPAPPAASPFGAPSASPFGAPSTTSAFGAPSTSPFALPSSSTSTTTSAFGTPSFGSTPAFGSTTFGAAPAFGSSPFGTPKSIAPTTTTPAPSAFTAPVGGGAFSGFGASSGTTGGFGGFAAATKPATAADGASPFGSGAKFGAAPAFGSTPSTTTTSGGFGGFGASGMSAFGATPATPKATTPTTGGFGGFSTPSTTTTPAAGGFGAFGSTTTPASTGGGGAFAAFGNTNAFATKAASPLAPGTSPFGSGGAFGSTTTTSAFGTGGSVGGSPSAFGAGGVGGSPSAFGSGGTATTSAFGGSGGSKTVFAAAKARGGDDSDEEEEEEMVAEEQTRVDEPPDLEPTVTGLDLGKSLAEAKSSTEGKKSGAGGFSAAPSTGGSAFGFGGLGFGAPPTTTTNTTNGGGLGSSIFGPAATTTTTPTPPAVEVEEVKPVESKKPSFNLGFGAAPSPTTDATKSTTPALAPATGFGFGSKPFGAASPSAASTGFSFGSSATVAPSTPGISTATSTGFNFGSAAAGPKTPSTADAAKTGFGFGTASITTPSNGFAGFGSKKEEEEPKKVEEEPKKVEDEPKEDVKPTIDPPASVVEPTPIERVSTPPISTPAPTSAATPEANTKSLFGFASSPPLSPAGGAAGQGSLLARLSEGEKNGDKGEAGEEDEGEEEYDEEGEGEYDEEGEEYGEYDEEEGEGEYPEDEGEYEEEEEEEEDADTTTDAPATSSSLLARLSPSPAPVAAPAFSFAPSPTGAKPPAFAFPIATAFPSSISPAATTEKKVDSAPPAFKVPAGFSFASPTPPATTTPATPVESKLSTPPVENKPSTPPVVPVSAPATTKPAFSFAAPAPAPAPEAKPVEGKKEESTVAAPAPKPTFGGFGTPAAAASPASSTPLAKAPAPSNFFGFTSSAPKSSSPLSAPPVKPPTFAPSPLSTTTAKPASSLSPFSFGQAPAAAAPAPAPAAKAAPSFFFSTPGSTTPLAVATPKPTLSFGAPTSAPALASPSIPPFTLGTPAVSPSVPVVAPSTPAPAPSPVASIKSGPSLATTSTPKVGEKMVGSTPSVQEKGMAGEFLKAYLGVQKDFEILRTNATVIKSFVHSIGQPYQTDAQPLNYDDRHWSLGDLERLKGLTKKVEPSVKELVGKAKGQMALAKELQSGMLKAETKREEALRFIRAKEDPALAKMVRVRQLGPEQLENQKKIRLSVEAVRSRVEQIEDYVLVLKDRLLEEKLGRSSFKAPSLDSVNRAVRNITVAVKEKTFELDELTHRLELLRVQPSTSSALASSTSSRHRSRSIEGSPNTSALARSTPIKSKALTPATFHPDVVATANAALNAERSVAVLKKALLAVRKEPLVNKSACANVQAATKQPNKDSISDLQLAFAKGPITGDRLPLPRRPPPPPSPPSDPPTPKFASSTLPAFSSPVAPRSVAPVAVSAPAPAFAWSTPPAPAVSSSWSMPAPPVDSPPPLTFKAMPQFSFAAPPTSLPSPPSTSRGSRNAGTATRSHSSAVQLRPTESPESKPASTTKASSFDWGVVPSTTPKKPVGFVSFGGGSTTPLSAPPPASTQAAVQDEEDDEDYYEEGGEEDYEDEKYAEEYTQEWSGEEDGEFEEGSLATIGEEAEE